MKNANDLGRDGIFPLVLKLSLPSMAAQLVNVLYSIIDRMYIGNIPGIGDLALAGVGVCGPIVTLLSSFGTLVGLGGSIKMAIRMGEKRTHDAEKILANSFAMLLGFSALLTVIFLMSKRYLLMWFGASEITYEYADTYLTIYTIGTFFALLAVGLNYFITCQGYSTVSMITVVVGAVTNIVLDSVFVIVFKWGVAGAAWATVIAQMLSCALVLLFLFGKTVPIRITFGGYSRKIMLDIVRLGFSPFLILATDSIIIIVMNTMLQKYGGAAEGDLLVSCATIVQSYFMLITGPLVGITGGTQAIISYNYGAKRSDRVRSAEKYILGMSICFTALMFLVSRFLPHYFSGIFTDSAEAINLSVWGIQTITLGIIPLAFQYTFVDGLTAMGLTRAALAMSITRKSTYCALTIILPALLGAKYAFGAEPVADIVCATLTTIVFCMIFGKALRRREMEAEI